MEYWPHPNTMTLVQTATAVIVAVLTLVLIVLNIIYVRANWRVMRLMETDLRFRTRPIPSFTLENPTEAHGWYGFKVLVSASNAPMRLLELVLKFHHADVHVPGQEHHHAEKMQVQNRVSPCRGQVLISGQILPRSACRRMVGGTGLFRFCWRRQIPGSLRLR
jgi:hypothetical protein